MASLHHVNAIPPWLHCCLAEEAKLDEGAAAGGSRYANPRVSDELILWPLCQSLGSGAGL